jgi:hypothetical protein
LVALIAALTLACAGEGGDGGATDGGTDTDTGDAGSSLACDGQLEIIAPGNGYIYVDARYTGLEVPGPIEIEIGPHRIGVGLVGGAYLLSDVDLAADTCQVVLDELDQIEPRTWRALWIGVADAQATVDDQLCETHATAEDLDASYGFFVESLQDQIEAYAFRAIEWEIERRDTTMPVTVSGGDDWFDIQPNDVFEITFDMVPGEYDAIFVFWKSQGDGCVIPGAYLGLGWSPQPATWWSGFVTIKFETDDIPGQIDYFQSSDPGPWTHEWLHTVCEGFYQGLGAELPAPDDGLVVHAAEEYGYEFPWMTWYEDLIGGRVAGEDQYLGIGPEALNACTVREEAVAPGECELP